MKDKSLHHCCKSFVGYSIQQACSYSSAGDFDIHTEDQMTCDPDRGRPATMNLALVGQRYARTVPLFQVAEIWCYM